MISFDSPSYKAIRDLSRQIEEKIRSGSMKRIGVNFFSKTILRLHNQIENLSQEVEQNSANHEA